MYQWLSAAARAIVSAVIVAALLSERPVDAQGVRGSSTYRPEAVGRVGAVAAGRNFAVEAAMRQFAAGGNAVDAGVAAVFAAAVSEISHFGLGGEVPIIVYLADRKDVVVINGQGPAPAAASPGAFPKGIPTNGPSAGTIPAVVDALAIALAEFGTRSLDEVLAPAIQLADGFPWYEALTRYLGPELPRMAAFPSGARVYLQGPGGTMPAVGSVFRQPELARTLRALAAEERRHQGAGRKAAIYSARDLFYRGDLGAGIAKAVQEAGGLMTATDLARYRGRTEQPTRGVFRTRHGTFEVCKTDFWGQGPVLLQALALLQGFDLERMGHNSTEYIHTVTEALKLALADRDAHYADPDFARVPAAVLLSDAYAAERRKLIDPLRADTRQRPGRLEAFGPRPGPAGSGRAPKGGAVVARVGPRETPDTTTINAADAAGNLFSASPSSAWFFGGVFIAGDTGIPLGNRMQAFVLDDAHPNVVQGGKRPRTTLSPTVALRDGRPFLALSSPGGDSQDQQALQVLLNIMVFNMAPQVAIEAPRFNSLHYDESFAEHAFHPGVLEVEDRIPPGVVEALRRLGHTVEVQGSFMMNTGTALVGIDSRHGTLFAAADPRRQRFSAAW